MISPHPTLTGDLARDRQDTLLREADHDRLVRAASATRPASRPRTLVARIPLAWHPSSIRSWWDRQPEPGPAEKEEGDDGSVAA
jgi:hypothetical protein